ncbi:MAG: cytochrome C [Saprospiraceae bacterium]|nr:cytochrome C [Saprospiraceae bacterium]
MRNFILLLLLLAAGVTVQAQSLPADVKKVSDKYGCAACHAVDTRIVGPSWKQLAKKGYSAKKTAQLIRKPKPEDWPGYPPMAPIPAITDPEAKIIADWLKSIK